MVSKLVLISCLLFSQLVFSAISNYVLFTGVFSGNFNKEYVEVLKRDPGSNHSKLFKIPHSYLPEGVKPEKGVVLQFEIKAEDLKRIKFKKVRN